MKRIIIEGKNSSSISIQNYPELKDKNNIQRVWSVYDEEETIRQANFNPFTGEKVTGLENAYLSHLNGVFLEDYFHDWRISGDEFHIYSRTRKKDEPIKLIIEMNND